jgi:hypothetical protein
MTTHYLAAGVFVLSLIPVAMAQSLPGAPEENGLTPKSNTSYVNRQTFEINNINNNRTESIGVAIANTGNVIIGWEDDSPSGASLEYLGAVWTLYDSGGVSITPEKRITALQLPGQEITSKFLSYFRADGSAVAGGTSWGPKIKANLFGDGAGMGATSYSLDKEVAEMAAFLEENGDFPSVQLLESDGSPVRIVTGISSAYSARSGDIRIADWDYLGNGNIVIVGESRQRQDLIDLYGGESAETHVIFRIVDRAGNPVKSETLANEAPVKSEMWHGVGVTRDGFAVRFAGQNGGATVRMFDNDGNPKGGNIDLETVTGHPQARSGGRGDSAGFHGNGKDAYVAVSGSGNEAWVTVLNTDGTVRFSRSVADDLELASVQKTDAAIDQDGNVIVVFAGRYIADYPNLVMGRRFDATGKPMGGTFYVSELELPGEAMMPSEGPRIAWRTGQVAVIWESRNDLDSIDPATGDYMKVVALRLFSTFMPGSIESAGLTRIVPDTPIIKPAADARGNWEPYASVLGTSTFLIEGSTYAENDPENQRYVVALQPVSGGPMKLGEGFFADNGQPFKAQINLSRQNGNPGRVAGDTRPGAVNFMVGGEASPHALPQFQSDNRWNLGFDRLFDGRYGTVQIFQLDTGTLTQTPLSKALDSVNGRETAGMAAGSEISRFGGEIVCLDNGNFLSVVEDRSRLRNPDGHAVAATIFAPDGSIVKESFVVAKGDIWSNVAPCKGGFAVRAKPEDESNNRLLYFYDNAGNLKGSIDQAASGASFDTGRGDGTRIFGHINSPYVFLAGRALNTTIVKVAVFDSRDQSFVTIADVSEGGFTGDFDRACGAVDALNRLVVSWVVKPAGYAQQQVAARVLALDSASKKVSPLTPSFFAFVNTATNDIRTLQMSVAMTTKQICVAAKGEINYENQPASGPNSPREVNFYTVFSHPDPKDDPTTPVGGAALTISSVTRSAGRLNVSWTGGAGPFVIQKKVQLTDASWTEVMTTAETSASLLIEGPSGFFRVQQR